jgi:murein hydrolase activator
MGRVRRLLALGIASLVLLLATTTFAVVSATRTDQVAAQPAPPPLPPPVSAPENPLYRAAVAGELDRAAALLDSEERKVRADYEACRHSLSELEQRLVIETRAYVRLTRAGLLPLSGGLSHLMERATRIARLKRSMDNNVRQSRELSARVVSTGAQLIALQKQRGPLSLEQLRDLRERVTIAQAQDRALAFERAFTVTPGSPASNYTAVYGANVPLTSSSVVPQRFTLMKGRLPFPIAGRAEIILTKRRGGGGPGLELRVAGGADVQAVFAGRVVFADRYADYGRTVILDHGEGFFSVSAGLTEMSVSVGQDVSGGARLGTLSSTGGPTSLYFELRLSGDPVEPAPWFGI